jgi:hypothetical protein
MQVKNIIRKAPPVIPPFAQLHAGDSVLVWDGKEGENVWLEIADILERDGRWKIRAVGLNFYFDEALVVNYTKGRDTDNPAAFPVSVLTSSSGSIGLFDTPSNCQQCGRACGQLFNVGTASECIYLCYECRSPSDPLAFIGQTFGHLRVTAIVFSVEDFLLLRCQCFCRQIHNVKSYDLVSGRVTSCEACTESEAA